MLYLYIMCQTSQTLKFKDAYKKSVEQMEYQFMWKTIDSKEKFAKWHLSKNQQVKKLEKQKIYT